MCAGCSEINISVIVKLEQHIGIISACCAWGNLLSFSVPWRTEKITESRFAGGISTQAGNVVYIYIYMYIYIYIPTGKDGGGSNQLKLYLYL